jgi:hypothetical protein
MRKLAKGILVLAATVAGSVFALFVGGRIWTRPVRICESIKPGAHLEDLTRRLGQPTPYALPDGKWYFFRTPSIMAGPMRAAVDEASGQVLTLRCHEDGPATWSLAQ